MSPVNPRQPPGPRRSWWVPASNARNSWQMPAIGSDLSWPDPDGPTLAWHVPTSLAARTWRVPAAARSGRWRGTVDAHEVTRGAPASDEGPAARSTWCAPTGGTPTPEETRAKLVGPIRTRGCIVQDDHLIAEALRAWRIRTLTRVLDADVRPPRSRRPRPAEPMFPGRPWPEPAADDEPPITGPQDVTVYDPDDIRATVSPGIGTDDDLDAAEGDGVVQALFPDHHTGSDHLDEGAEWWGADDDVDHHAGFSHALVDDEALDDPDLETFGAGFLPSAEDVHEPDHDLDDDPTAFLPTTDDRIVDEPTVVSDPTTAFLPPAGDVDVSGQIVPDLTTAFLPTTEDRTVDEPAAGPEPVDPPPRVAPPYIEEPRTTGPRPVLRGAVRGTEHGDRARFLAEVRRRIARAQAGSPVSGTGSHEPPVPVPEPGYANVDLTDLVGSFVQSVEAAGGVCHYVAGDLPDSLLDLLVAELDVWKTVVSGDEEVRELAERLGHRGVEVTGATPEHAMAAGMGVTSAAAGIAATGALVLDSQRDKGRLAALLPPVHLCLLPIERLVATPSDVLRSLGHAPRPLPSSLMLLTGPSRGDDIEKLLTIGALGPAALHVVLLERRNDL